MISAAEGETRHENSQPSSYSLMPEDFTPEKAPQEPVEWHFPDPVNRANFMPFFIKSFAISQGYNPALLLFYEYVDVQTGFDMVGTLQNIANTEIYGRYEEPLHLGFWFWPQLSDEERDLFQDFYKRIKKHDNREAFKEDYTKEQADIFMAYSIGRELAYILLERKENREAQGHFDLSNLDFRQFLTDLQPYIKEGKDASKKRREELAKEPM